ncbi:arsenate reductase family protein [Paenibacillus aurantius]|uniref:Arsenate reductase family protein n=1 Tax=Paenibacillus aurantius TaxID=2918900 RepID=A0AA96LAK6_9BACL|nr:arsenate reductase family protein [Paenibacillus aurantius]WNQ10224.1 arsenate reductase family protein [Paenibacillus aurantius]
MGLTLYGYAKCGTCREAKKELEAKGYDVHFHDIVESPPPVEEIRRLVETSGLPLSKFFNVSGEVYREWKLKDRLPGMNEEEKLELLASNGKLIKRPIVTDGKRVTVGFKKPDFGQAWAP